MNRIITDQLVGLSSMAVVNIRDAVTEAALTIGQKAVACQCGLRGRIELTQRQLQAEQSKSSSAGGGPSKNPKLVAIQKQHKRLEDALKNSESLSSTVFNSIFVHRFKDSHDNVRALCVKRLGDWLSSDPERLYKDEYVKYAGWATFDHAHVVRKEAARSVGKLLLVKGAQAQGSILHLSAFFNRFMERFIEIAVGDIDETISLEMLRVLRDLQSKGTWNECHLSHFTPCRPFTRSYTPSPTLPHFSNPVKPSPTLSHPVPPSPTIL